MFRVSISRGDLLATFGIDPRRGASFFKDRVDVCDPNTGHKKRIFHIVRPHSRRTGVSVKMHFRGLRTFMWNDYSVHITVPGLHHPEIWNYTAGAVDIETVPNARGYVSTRVVAKQMHDLILDR